ncbi:hypothetical protein G6F62_015206 [Rhizopus arrhizus]|nr:hypothetical protein G6F62_015206 [Rhizopus arrhizus]
MRGPPGRTWRDATPARRRRHGLASAGGRAAQADPRRACADVDLATAHGIGAQDQRGALVQSDGLEHRQLADPDLHGRVLPTGATQAGQGRARRHR